MNRTSNYITWQRHRGIIAMLLRLPTRIWLPSTPLSSLNDYLDRLSDALVKSLFDLAARP